MNAPDEPTQGRLGAFIGVFTPTVLTILGVILFLRTGWLVAVAGVGGAIAIVVVANLITMLTALSVSALATNMRVGVGGAYYIISRSLGLEVGGAVGIPLYLSQVLSVTLYCFGLAESLRIVWADVPVVPVAAFLVVFVTLVASRSTELTLKMQLPVMVLIGAAIVSLFLGASWGSETSAATWGPFEDAAGPVGFWGAFAVFFPAVTGILAGVSLSGDLEDPAKAIPRGVLWAVSVGFVVYLLTPIALATSMSREVLLDDSLVWTQIALVPVLVMPGLWGAILSSAFGSILGAPRTLQALAHDHLVPRGLGQVDPETGEPRLGLLLSGLLAVCAVWLGDLNAVASWVTIFFLTTYGALNTVAVVEIMVDDPSYRPTLRIPWWAALGGAIGCFIAMFAVDATACLVAITVEAAIFYVLRKRSLEAEFGDVRSGLILSLAHVLVRWYTDGRHDPRNWRPTVLVLTHDLVRDLPAVRMAASFGDTRGILTVMNLEAHPLDELPRPQDVLPAKQSFLRDHGIDAFCELAALPHHDDTAMAALIQAHGFGGMNANTVMFTWDGSDVRSLEDALRHAPVLARLDRSTLIFRPSGRGPVRLATNERRRIVVWWKGLESNGDLMLLLTHLLTRSDRYRDARILLRTIVTDTATAESWRVTAGAMIERIRMEVEAEALVLGDGETVSGLLRAHSTEAHLVLMGISQVAGDEVGPVAERMAALCKDLPDTLLVRNEGPFRGRLV